MRRPHFIAAQSRRPTGWLGRAIGALMAHETAAANDAVLDLLGPGDCDRLLDVGCGPGRTVERAARLMTRGSVAGVDVSEEMLRLATRRCRDLIAAGRVELCRGDAEQLPYPDGSFDHALSVHTLYFWERPAAVVREIRRVLNPRGRLALAFRCKEDRRFVADFPASVYRFYSAEDVARLLLDAGFQRIDVSEGGAGTPVTVVIAACGSA